jgi:hypothetical protein
MSDFSYQDMFPLADDATPYRRLSENHVTVASFEDRDVLKVSPDGLTYLAEQAFSDVSHLLRPAHLKQLEEIFDDPESSANDRYVMLELLKNAAISAERIFPMCQDTGTAVIIGKKGLFQRPFYLLCRPGQNPAGTSVRFLWADNCRSHGSLCTPFSSPGGLPDNAGQRQPL